MWGKGRGAAAVWAAAGLGSVLVAIAVGPAGAQEARDYVSIVGPRTVYPYVSKVIDAFAPGTRFKYPRIETTDTGAGIKLLCAGEGYDYPDIAMANRPMSEDEERRCGRNAVVNLSALRIGFDAIALVRAADPAASTGPAESATPPGAPPTVPPSALSLRSLFVAVAGQIPDPAAAGSEAQAALGAPLVDNPYTRWAEVDDTLPDLPIRVLVPPPTAIASDLFMSEPIRRGCRAVDGIAAFADIDPATFARLCRSLRGTAEVEEITGGLDAVRARIAEVPGSLAVVPQAFLVAKPDAFEALRLDGALPTIAAINAGDYPAARPIFLFVKVNHFEIVPGLRDFVTEFIGKEASGPDGYLVEVGLVPLTEEERSQVSDLVTTIVRPDEPEEPDAAAPGGGGPSAEAQLRDVELGLWDRVRDSDDPGDLETYVVLFPDGIYAGRAQSRIAVLKQRDGDRDDVADHLDECPETATGVEVDDRGCPTDRDGDGVADGTDQCPDTPGGIPVDATGCPPPPDRDGDGVYDPDDACPDSAPGAAVGADGCVRVADRDRDGVPDNRDRCAVTPFGASVDATGCWVVSGLEFDAGDAVLTAAHRTVLTEVAGVLAAAPGTRIRVVGHSDDRGGRALNIGLSRQRAEVVAAFLAGDGGIDPAQLEVVAVGSDQPLASNRTAEGRRRNRRVEIVPIR